MSKVSLRADIRLLRLAIERGLLSWEDLEAVPQPTDPGMSSEGAVWGPWISRIIESGHLDEGQLIALIRQLDPEADEPLPAPDEIRAPVPDNWDRYHIFAPLGSGGMGSVFKAFDPQLNRFVALKFLHNKNPQFTKAFLDEARAQAQVEHPLICQVYEVGEVEAQPYIAMRFIDGRPLLETANRFPLVTKVRLVQQVADALQAAHQKGLIHRDIKPGNILLTTNQKGALRCVVVDFGLAQSLGARGDDGDEVAGTPDYLSPEQLTGETIDHRTDIYSLGIVLYELLTGQVPFRGKNIGQTLQLIAAGNATPPSKSDSSIPRDLDAIVLKAIAKEPADRYSSATELMQDLRRFLNGEPILAHSTNVSYRVRKFVTRHRWASVAALATVLALLGLGAFSLYGQARARQQAELARRFGEEVREMEASMRFAALLPAQDLSRHRTELGQRMDRLTTEMRTLGPLANGPGNYALGRGYLALHRYELAKQHLETAWAAGYRRPEVASALGEVIGRLFDQATYASPLPGNSVVAEATRAELARVFREPAIEYLRAGSTDSSGQYVQALVAFHEGRYEDAVAAAEAAHGDRPWFFEAPLLVGRIQEARGDEAAYAGDYDRALGYYDQAGALYDGLKDIARSDASIRVAHCRCLNQRNETHRSVGRLLQELVDEAREACDAAIVIDPQLAEAYSLKSRISWRWADAIRRRGADPRPELGRSMEYAQTAIERNPESSSAYQNLATSLRLLGNWQMVRGIDPVPTLTRAIAAAHKAIELQPGVALAYNSLGNAAILLARHEITHGQNPEEHFAMATSAYEKALEGSPSYVPAMLNLGNAWITRTDWEIPRGEDPAPSIARALVPLNQAIELNPHFLQLHNNLGNAHSTLALTQYHRGQDPSLEVDAAIASYQRALEINPDYAIAAYNVAFAERLRAQHLLLAGLDPSAAEDRAESSIRDAIRINGSDPENFIELAELELVRARRAASTLGDPGPAVRAADAAIAEAKALNSDVPRLYYLEALGRKHLAQWNLSRGNPAAALVSRGMQLADQAVALNPTFNESIALQGVLLKLQSQLLTPPQRDQVAQRAIQTLEGALAANPSLERDYRPELVELQRLVGAG